MPGFTPNLTVYSLTRGTTNMLRSFQAIFLLGITLIIIFNFAYNSFKYFLKDFVIHATLAIYRSWCFYTPICSYFCLMFRDLRSIVFWLKKLVFKLEAVPLAQMTWYFRNNLPCAILELIRFKTHVVNILENNYFFLQK